MHDIQTILHQLKDRGYRNTKIRVHILEAFRESRVPVSSLEMQRLLANAHLTANKTTVYRELSFLAKSGIIRMVQFADSTKRYEFVPENHHHHLICLHCHTVQDIPLERDLDAQEKTIAHRKKFKIVTHSLEFYGICRTCLKKRVSPRLQYTKM
jgi:Fur family transcriptional regulator, ferric uptake regulator